MTTTRPTYRLLLAGLLAAALVTGCGNDDPGEAEPSATPSETSSSDTASPEPTVEAAVWFMVDTRAGVRLIRETRDLGGADPAQGAVETMIAGSQDPDYSTPWDPETDVLGVTSDAETVTVDLSEEARTASIGSEGAALMIQQLVYTVTEVEGSDSDVLLLIEGEPAGELWGAVTWDDPVGRADPLDVRSLVQIDFPREGAAVPSPVEVKGEAAAFEATVPWRVLDSTGTEVESGFTMTSEGQTFADFSFKVPLDPGTYTIEISEDDASGGEGGPPMIDTRTVTVE